MGLSRPGLSAFGPDTTRIDTSDYIPSYDDYNLLVASYKGYSSEVLRLLNKGADVNANTNEGVTPLMYAVDNGDIQITRILVLNGADINRKPHNGVTALLSSTLINHLDIAEFLIRNGANINDPDAQGISPLMYAVIYNYPVLRDMLIYYGADIHQTDNEGNNPLILAVFMNNPEIVEIFLDQNANVNSEDKNGFTPLMLAAQNGDTAIMNLLINKQADLNAKNKYGNTALSLAVKNGHIEAVNLLIRNETGQHSVYKGKDNLRDLAKKFNHKNMVGILKQHGFRGTIAPSLDIYSIGPGLNLNYNDFMFGINAGIQDTKYNIRANLGYYTRPFAKRILLQDSEDTYFQFWEKRSLVSVGFEKLFSIKSFKNNRFFAITIGMDGIYTYGRNYRGSIREPDKKFKLSPTLGLICGMDYLQLVAKYSRLDLDTFKVSPHRAIIGVQYIFDKRKRRYKDKQIEWLD
jgi:ankyrin repeat protein